MLQLYVDFTACPLPTSPKEKSSYLPKPFSGKALIDSGATSCFILSRIVEDFHLRPQKRIMPKKLQVIDGREVNLGLVTEFVTFSLEIQGHIEQIECHVVNIGNNGLVLGMSWLNKHNPSIQWDERAISFSSPHCSKNCLSNPHVFQINGAELPEAYQEFAKVFSEEEASKLPPHRLYDIAIDLLPDAKPRHGPIYSHNVAEDEELRETIKKQLASGWIRLSTSPMASPILFVKRKMGRDESALTIEG
jgi:hypothetical protein